jgi:hypothetical protein
VVAAIAAAHRISLIEHSQRRLTPPLFLTLHYTAMQQHTLSAILQYRNEDILSRFIDLFDVTEAEAEDIFTETKKFLFICRQPGVFIPDELLIVDEMWHNFILFTATYHEFCTHHFGCYLHHLPASKAEKTKHREQLAANAEAARKDFKEKLTAFMAVTYDQLGSDTVVKWFQQYPRQYSKQAIKNLRKN